MYYFTKLTFLIVLSGLVLLVQVHLYITLTIFN